MNFNFGYPGLQILNGDTQIVAVTMLNFGPLVTTGLMYVFFEVSLMIAISAPYFVVHATRVPYLIPQNQSSGTYFACLKDCCNIDAG